MHSRYINRSPTLGRGYIRASRVKSPLAVQVRYKSYSAFTVPFKTNAAAVSVQVQKFMQQVHIMRKSTSLMHIQGCFTPVWAFFEHFMPMLGKFLFLNGCGSDFSCPYSSSHATKSSQQCQHMIYLTLTTLSLDKKCLNSCFNFMQTLH